MIETWENGGGMIETWENTYSGFTPRYGYTDHIMATARRLLPAPAISPTCAKKGHKWGVGWTPIVKDVTVRGCERCARRGLVVLRTDAA